MNNFYIDEEIMQGEPLQIERYLMHEIANQILVLNGSNYENTCDNMRMFADVFELLEEHINDDFIILKYNPMGAWYIEENEEMEVIR